jgi:SAM-dependent methyltransferase
MPEHSRLSDAEIELIFGELICIQQQEDCHLLQFESLVAANQYRLLYRLVRKYIATGSVVLDWGSGNGHCSYALCELKYKPYGFEFGDFPLRKYLRCSYELRQGNPKDPITIPYSDGTFDAVVSVGVLEHVRETGGTEEASLREISRILKPGGYFICYHLPNRFSLIEALARRLPQKHHHRYRYTGSSIRHFCQRTGYDLLETSRYGALPRNIWNKIPQLVSNSQLAAGVWNSLDRHMSFLFAPLCQNYLFVARKSLLR